MLTRQVTWGDALYLEVKRIPGGLKAAYEDIAQVVGDYLGTRNTYAKLYGFNDPAELDRVELLRAWLLVTALGLNLSDWDLDDDAVPDFMVKPTVLRARLAKLRESRLGESNSRPIHYKWVGRRSNGSLLPKTGNVA